MPVRSVIELLRPYQYSKNLFLLLPALFGMKITEPGLLPDLLLSVILFSLVTSSAYIFNDILDVESDRNHPIKKNRPLPSGRITETTALIIAVLLFSGAGAFSYLLFPSAAFMMGAYFGWNIIYTLFLKQVALIDISAIGVSFVLRLYIGSAVADVPLSQWIVVMTFLLALFLALAKRRAEFAIIEQSSGITRKSLSGYTLSFFNVALPIMASVVIVAYIMYTILHDTVTNITPGHNLFLTSAFVILGIMRYLILAYGERNMEDPAQVLLDDRFLQLVILAWAATVVVMYYL